MFCVQSLTLCSILSHSIRILHSTAIDGQTQLDIPQTFKMQSIILTSLLATAVSANFMAHPLMKRDLL
ncbi:Uncharacterized protein HZ326_15384, partial [Fusarium oxysporum f. sp. albedinis]